MRGLSFLRNGLVVVLGGLGAMGVCAHAATPFSVLTPMPTIKPAAPISQWINPTDKARLSETLDALKRKQYALANVHRQKIADPMAQSVASWAYLRNRSVKASATEIGQFLDQHYGWPDKVRMQTAAENSFTIETSAQDILGFFDQRDPITGDGHLHLARAFLTLRNEDAARAQIKRAWVDYNWSSKRERDILSLYGGFLTQDDHWKKVDRQLFEVRATATERLLLNLAPNKRAEANVRIAFLKLDRNAVALYGNLSQTSKMDSGVLLAATRYYRRSDIDDKAITYASLAPLDRDSLRDPERWFYERKLLARWALKTGRFEDVYTLSAYSGLKSGAKFAEAEFLAGWVALRFLNDPERAKAHFAFIGTGVTSPISLARGEYWLARAWAASGDEAAATQHFRVAAAYPYTYYGQLAIDELGPTAPRISFPKNVQHAASEREVFEARPMVHAMRILAELDQFTSFDRFARALDDQIESPGEVDGYYDLVIGERKTYLAVRAGKVARNNGAAVPGVIYPMIMIPQSAKRFVEEPLILGLSRQESEFNPRAYSRARARGLMQLLASTAKITVRKEGMPFSVNRLMDDPNYNLTVGAAHLSHLLKRFKGSYIMVLAGYNAGPHRVDQWVKTYGDPRDPSVDPIDWIELIPFSETRNYVMRVLENTQVYRSRITGDPIGGRLSSDLVRGGNSRDSFGIFPPAPNLMAVSFEDEGGPNIWINTPDELPDAVKAFSALSFPPLDAQAVNAVDNPATPEVGAAQD